MLKRSEAFEASTGGTARRVLLAGAAVLLGATATSQVARAQFFFWDQPRVSADDAARSVIERGFRPLARPVRNRDVYVADVIDRRGRRERLIVSSDSGDIVQRFYVDDGQGYRRYADPSIPRGPVPPGRIPDTDQSNVFSRLLSGDDTEDTPATSAVPERTFPAPESRQPPRVKRRPRVVERTPEQVRPSTPIESAPLAPVSPPASPPAQGPVATGPSPAPAATSPQRSADAPSDRPVRSILSNPLSIPGTREPDETPARRTGTASATAPTAAPAAPKPAAAPQQPPAPQPVAVKPPLPADVPVAPLD